MTNSPAATSCEYLLGAAFSVATQRNGTSLSYLNETTARSVWIKLAPPSRVPDAKITVSLPSVIKASHRVYTDLSGIQLAVNLPSDVASCVPYLADGVTGMWVDVSITVEKGSVILDARQLTLFYPDSYKIQLRTINILSSLYFHIFIY